MPRIVSYKYPAAASAAKCGMGSAHEGLYGVLNKRTFNRKRTREKEKSEE